MAAPPSSTPPAGPLLRSVASPLLAAAGVVHLFSTRHFPVIGSPVGEGGPFGPAARAAIGEHGLDAERIAFARQVHGAAVAVARAGGRLGPADVVITDRPGLPVAVLTADCLPIVIHDPGGDGAPSRLAVVHAGWRGTTQGVSRAAVESLIRAGGEPSRFAAVIGPSIGPCCYEVDWPVIERFEATLPGLWPSWVRPARAGHWMLDLWRANRDQLVAAGLGPGRIENLALCTSCRLDLFFSFRRGARGRLTTIAALPVPAGGSC
ncbi:MAG TPA: polyphenol oxidase family protein [Candidatus Binatia bacterium]|nr:polyphenol oxidase family protein [Candidatus Binatia bacterium]